VLLLATLSGCATNPYTQRHQLLLVSPEYEERLGEEAYREILKSPGVRLASDPRQVERVERVAQRVIAAARQSRYAAAANHFQWEVAVIDDDATLNAFALPGGKIAIYTGLFRVTENDAGLAAIIGHEIVHALARHSAERMSQSIVAELVLAGSQAAGTSAEVMQALGLGAQIGLILPFGRAHESEADYIGLLLAAQAGYDPREAVRVWERMSQEAGSQPPEFLSTHPSHGTRIAQLEEWMPEALRIYREASARDKREVKIPKTALPGHTPSH
jgi:predicted Zn-dependent protease